MALRTVTFEWDDSHGNCYECGRPAAYIVPDAYTPGLHEIRVTPEDHEAKHLRCAICAALAAAVDGERIVYLNV